MTENLPFDIHVICKVLGLAYGKFYRWIKDHISSFQKVETQLTLHFNDVEADKGSYSETILVPILKQEHIGEHMAIDEKHINNRFHTIFSNAQTGKVALMCSTIKINEVKECLEKFGDKINEVKYISRDLASTFKKISTDVFPNAIQIADKFHVVKNGIEYLQSLRNRLKQEVLKQQREAQVTHEKHYTESKNKKFIGPKLKVSKRYKPPVIENGETLPELLARSRYLCAIHQENWNIYQQKRSKLLFKYFPCMEEAYYILLEFRNWYQAKPSEYEPFLNEKNLGNWSENHEKCTINEMQNFRNLVSNHEEEILNYHKHGNKTNAIAESINAKIADANRKNRGTRDVNFFNYILGLII